MDKRKRRVLRHVPPVDSAEPNRRLQPDWGKGVERNVEAKGDGVEAGDYEQNGGDADFEWGDGDFELNNQ